MGVLKLNKEAKFNTYPMSRIKEISKKIGSSVFISTLDLAKVYSKIPMMAASMEKTAYATPFGQYELDLLPFGLQGALATFQRMMNHIVILRGCQSFSGAYVSDDVVVFSKSCEEHLKQLKGGSSPD